MRRENRKHSIFLFILAGGVGTRFWPMSTPNKPKQFLKPPIPEFKGKTFLQATYERCKQFTQQKNIFIITQAPFIPTVQAQIKGMDKNHIIVEPKPRDTAGALALALAVAKKHADYFTLVLLPSDHLIKGHLSFARNLKNACAFSRKHRVNVTLGVPPTFPATGYGYLQKGPVAQKKGGKKIFYLKRFIEKPPLPLAKRLARKGSGFFWNSGIFVFDGARTLDDIKKYLPKHHRLIEAFTTQTNWQRQFLRLPKVSIDVGLMEKASDLFMIPAQFQWDDIGNWESLEKFLKKTPDKNFKNRPGLFLKSKGNTFIFDPLHTREVISLGMEDTFLIQDGGRLLICKKEYLDDLKKAVQTFYE